MGLPSPIPAIPSYGPIYIDPHYEFPRDNIELTDILYDGTFTVIYKAMAVGINEKPIEVAIKSIKGGCGLFISFYTGLTYFIFYNHIHRGISRDG